MDGPAECPTEKIEKSTAGFQLLPEGPVTELQPITVLLNTSFELLAFVDRSAVVNIVFKDPVLCCSHFILQIILH